MPRKKHIYYQKFTELPNTFSSKEDLSKEWSGTFFQNDAPLILEVGCGKGEYTVGLGELFPENNYVGIDVKGARMYRGASYAMEHNLENIAFVRMQVEEIDQYFAPHSISEIWVTFPDPQPRKGKAKKRLTSQRFLNMYKNLLKEGGIVHLKTDNFPLYEYSLETFQEEGWKVIDTYPDITKAKKYQEELSIETAFEKKHKALGSKITYIRATQ